MNTIPISPQIWELASQILTPKQHTVLELREKHGYSWNQIAIYTNATRATAKEHHRAATKNLLDAIEHAAGDIDRALELHAIAHGPLEGLPQPRPTSDG